MGAYILRRLLLIVPTLVGVLSVKGDARTQLRDL